MRGYIGIGLIAVMINGISGAYAQNPTAMLSPEETRECLCWHHNMQAMIEEGMAQYGMLMALDQEIESRRQTMSAGDPGAVSALSRMIEMRNALRTAIRQGYSPPANADGDFDTYYQIYNERCAGRMMRRIDVEAFQANTASCPAPSH